jgi:hypothetical protein
MDQTKRGNGMTKPNVCAGLGPLNPCVAWLLIVFSSVLLVAAIVLWPDLNMHRLLASAVVAMGATALVEVIRHYWTDRHVPSSPTGAVRVLALWFSLWVLMYAMDKSYPFSGGDKGNENGISLVTGVLGFVLALTTLVATKVAADAKTEVQAVHDALNKSKDIAFLAESSFFNFKVQSLLAWRVEIMLAMEQYETDQQQSALLEGLGKTIKALKVPLEEAPRWGTSTLNHSALIQQAVQASALLKFTPDLAGAVQLLLGRAGGENQLREVGEALGRFLEHVRSRHPQSTPAEHGAWEALAGLSQDLKRL